MNNPTPNCEYCEGTGTIWCPEENHHEPCICTMEEPLVIHGQGDYEKRIYPSDLK
jgi:hypothetical protein